MARKKSDKRTRTSGQLGRDGSDLRDEDLAQVRAGGGASQPGTLTAHSAGDEPDQQAVSIRGYDASHRLTRSS